MELMDEQLRNLTSEQQEQLRNLTPEQLAQLQQQACIFCQIISGSVPAMKVFEDAFSIAILDRNPGAPGHMLLMPKQHFAIMPQLPEELLGRLFVNAKRLSQAALRGLASEGTTILVANGIGAGQRSPHFIVHVIPRTAGDNVGIEIPEPAGKLPSAAVAIRERLRGSKTSLEDLAK